MCHGSAARGNNVLVSCWIRHQEGDMAKGQMRPQKEKKKPKKNKDKKKGGAAPSPFMPETGKPGAKKG
jgi:hypothetical protein